MRLRLQSPIVRVRANEPPPPVPMLPLPPRPGRRWRRRGWALLAAAVAVAVAASGLAAAQTGGGTPPLGNGADPNAEVLSLGDRWSIWNPAPGQLGTIGVGFAADQVLDENYCQSQPTAVRRMPCAGTTAKRILTTWSRHYDDSTAPPDHGAAVSEQNGQVFTVDPNGTLFDGLDLSTAARLRDGRILTADFNSGNATKFSMGASSDVGRTWTRWSATLTQPATPLAWTRIQRTILELPDGTILMTGYGALSATGEGVSLVFESHDGAHTFTVRSILHGPRGVNEMAMARTTDGRLVALLRQAGSPSGLLQLYPLLQTSSDDDGRTWSTPTELQAPAGMPNAGADPNIILLPNGTLMASYGRPDNSVLVSWDGTGQHWDKGDTVYANPALPTDPGRYHGSSGNTTIQAVGTNYALYWADTCHTIYLCREYGQNGEVFVRRVDALKGGAGKLDLMSRYLEGTVKLDGQVLPASPLAPEARLAGAIDGSTGPNAAAFLKPGTGLTVTLDQPRELNQIGLMLADGVAQSVDIQTSLDGHSWGKPVVKIRDSVDYAMRYYTFPSVTARYVRISPTIGSQQTTISELELYSPDTWTFENDAPNAVPRGFINTRYATIADYLFPGWHSEKRMILVDMDPNSEATATLPTTPVPAQHASFAYSGEGYGAGIIWDVNGVDAAGHQVTAYRFRLTPDATATFTLSAWDGSAWQTVSTRVIPKPANEVLFPVSIDATGTTANLSVNGTAMTTTVRAGTTASTFDGLTFTTNGDTAVNMEASFDEINVTPLGAHGAQYY